MVRRVVRRFHLSTLSRLVERNRAVAVLLVYTGGRSHKARLLLSTLVLASSNSRRMDCLRIIFVVWADK
ncbi:hypothetical protein H2248_011905 [Termitomyces sp. 'cryptogamus']|nr:hypothetical protein H2248_011905 [Termitomyces sp. 'cryptogamus']